jgi:phospholipid/cholesterol/gamma-HCH transport system ATP-binding protein
MPEPTSQAAGPGDESAEPQTIAELSDIHLAFGEQEVLSGVDLEVRERERVVVMGQSGGGKSTLLRLVLGILRPTKGSVRFKGLEVTRMGRRRLNKMRQKIGMVYQYSALISSLSVRDNLALALEELTDKKPAEIDELVKEKLELVGMFEAREKMPSELSGGMKKRVGLARALMLDPELILYDEPSAGLDPVSSSMIDELMINLSEQLGCASIIVTHELDSAFKTATRMAMLYQGKIIAQGTPTDFRDHPHPVVAQFMAGETEGPLVQSK